MVAQPNFSHLRHRDLNGLARGRLRRTRQGLAAFGAKGAETRTFTVNATNEQLTVASVTWQTNDRVVLTTTNTLPAPLQTGVLYFVIRVNATTVQLRAGETGAAINITNAGTGTHSIHKIYNPGYPK